MKTISLIAFRGVGFLNPQYTNEDPLIKAGHVGFQLEGDSTIYGFHPTGEAIEEIGGLEAALAWLKTHQILAGAIFDDSAVFERAFILSQDNPELTVLQLDCRTDEEEFAIIKANVMSWIDSGQTSPYRWPERTPEPMPEEVDNCATFPRKLGISIPERTGRMKYYMKAMRENKAKAWQIKDQF